VTTSDQLLAAAASGDTHIVVDGTLSGMPMITLKPGVTLSGGTLRFGARGIQLTSDNTVSGTRILCPDHEVAISNELDNPSLGTITLTKVETTGQVLLLADGKVTAGSVVIDDLTVLSADVTGRSDRPHGYGVDALQGAFTLWNRQSDPTSEISAQLRDIKVGSVDCPVRGSGIFVGGYGDREGRPTGGRVNVTELTTGDVVSNGGIAEGTPDLISGGVFVQVGAVVDLVRNIGAVTTLGANDMVLDNWGEVREWVAEGAITSRGPSGIGFVNFGKLGTLEVSSPIETWGQGARGFNLYDGSLEQATFDSITTHGDGAVGMQITKPLPKVRVNGDIRTTGGEGTSLVRGQQVLLKAIAFSLKVGGSLQSLEVSGTVESTGDNVITMEVHGPISALTVSGGVSAQGKGSDAVHASGDTARIEALTLYSADGVTLVHTPEA
jgi:hypothetical protein